MSYCPEFTGVTALVNPTSPTAETALRDIEPAARAMGMQIKVLNASTSGEIHAAFATFVQERPDALFVSPNSMFTTRRVQLAHLTTRHRIPATYASREFAEVGGLMSYGSSQSDNYRQVGISASSRARSLPTCPSPIHADVLTLALRQTDRSNRRDHRILLPDPATKSP